ncbi:MAG: hypothetical protein KGR98_06730 [Verrucomicrobia bacterium]|nr:hypothetical protein [Verrucomicrobiota bacterium]
MLPLAVFLLVMAGHALYVRHEARLPVKGWAADSAIVDNGLWGFRPYFEAQNYLTGYAYALPLAFAAVALRRYRECRQRRRCGARNAAIGGVTLAGVLAGSGCFLLGCCGSPMLGVYLSLFGASFLPWAKPLVAGLTTVMIAAAYWWMRSRSLQERSREPCCTPSGETASGCK